MWRRSKAPWSSSSASEAARGAGCASGSGAPGARLVGSGFLVGVSIEEFLHVGGVVGLHAEHPGGERVGVDLLGRIAQRGVGGDHLARERRIDVGGGLHRLHHAHGLAGLHLAANRGRLHEHDVAELLLRVVGDADRHGAVALAAHPFVGLGVAQVGGKFHGASFMLSTRDLPRRTKTGFTTRAARDLSRTCTCTVAPGATPRGRRASAMERASVGENVPLVISPAAPSATTFWWPRSTPPGSSSTRPRNSWRWPRASSAARPTKSRPSARSTVQARPASNGETRSSMSWP